MEKKKAEPWKITILVGTRTPEPPEISMTMREYPKDRPSQVSKHFNDYTVGTKVIQNSTTKYKVQTLARAVSVV